jgi:hypothetical protein
MSLATMPTARLSSSKVRRTRCDVARWSFLSSISKAATWQAYAP